MDFDVDTTSISFSFTTGFIFWLSGTATRVQSTLSSHAWKKHISDVFWIQVVHKIPGSNSTIRGISGALSAATYPEVSKSILETTSIDFRNSQ